MKTASLTTNRKNSSKNENFKRICLVSSAAFSAASCVWPWTAPIGASLGLYASIDTKDQPELEEEFTNAVDAALRKTRNNLTTDDNQKIIDELSADIVRPDNIDELISKTETYRNQYCTILDRKRIVDMFEMYFKEEVCKCNTLSNYYLLAAGTVTIDTIKSVSDALIKQDKKLSAIQKGVDEINNKATRIFAIFRLLLCECGYVLIAVAGCLLMALPFDIHVPFFYIQIIICYLLSSLFTSSILGVIKAKVNGQNVTNTNILKEVNQVTTYSMVFNCLIRFLIYTAISIGVYLIIVSSQSLDQVEQQSETIVQQVECVAMGCMVSCCLKVLPQLWINRHKQYEDIANISIH